jgi:hypothetical protein
MNKTWISSILLTNQANWTKQFFTEMCKKSYGQITDSRRKIVPINHKLANIVYCSCCLLPRQTKNVVKPYSFCVEDKKLTAIGLGTFLYFYFLKFSSLILLIAFTIAGIPHLTATLYYFKNLESYCSRYSVNDYCDNFSAEAAGTNWLYIMSYEGARSYKLLTELALSIETARLNEFLMPYVNVTQSDGNITEVLNTTVYNNITLEKNETIYNMADESVLDLSFLNNVAMVVIFIANLCGIVDCHCYLYEDDESKITPSDYALMITNVPEIRDKSQLLDFLTIDAEQYSDVKDPQTGTILTAESRTVELKPIDIIYTYKTHALMKLKSKLLEVSKQIRYCKITGDDYVTGLLCKKVKTLADFESKKAKIRKKLRERMSTKMREFTGVVIAIFNTQTEKDLYLGKFPKSFAKRLFDKVKTFCKVKLCRKVPKGKTKTDPAFRKIKVGSAPEPEDILWHNIQFTQKDKIKTVLWVYCVSVFLICCSFGTIIGITYAQNNAQKKNLINVKDDFKTQITMSISISLVVTVINSIIKITLLKLSE